MLPTRLRASVEDRRHATVRATPTLIFHGSPPPDARLSHRFYRLPPRESDEDFSATTLAPQRIIQPMSSTH